MFVLPNLSPLAAETPSSFKNYLEDEKFRTTQISDFVRRHRNIDRRSPPVTSEFKFKYNRNDDSMRTCEMKCKTMEGGFHYYVQELNSNAPNKHDKHANSNDFETSATDTLEELLLKMYNQWQG